MVRTYREARIRKRVRRALGAIRFASTGKNRDHGIGRTLRKARIKAGFVVKPFMISDSQATMSEADRAFLPSRADFFKVLLSRFVRASLMHRHSKRKEKIVQSLFGSGMLGIIMVKPELFAQREKVKTFLRRMGIQIVFSTPFVFSKYDLQRLYPHVIKDRAKYSNFAVQAFSLLNAPCNVIVFRHKQPAEYKQMASSLDIGLGEISAAPQDAFNAVFKKFLRENIARRELEAKGFKRERVSGPARKLDALGFFESQLPKGFDMLGLSNGLHFPDSKEILLDARTLLMFTDLRKIAERIS